MSNQRDFHTTLFHRVAWTYRTTRERMKTEDDGVPLYLMEVEFLSLHTTLDSYCDATRDTISYQVTSIDQLCHKCTRNKNTVINLMTCNS